MNRQAEFEKMRDEYQNIKGPKEGIEIMECAIKRAQKDKKEDKRNKMVRNFGIGMAAALALVALPNMSENAAYAMGNMPLVGGFFKVITVREYAHQDEYKDVVVKTPQVVAEKEDSQAYKDAADKVNKSVDEYTKELVEQFNLDMSDEGYHGLQVSYETVTNTDQWFTLKITGEDIQASAEQFNRFYNIDKTTGKVVELKDLFKKDADYITPISENIIAQMKEQQKAGTATYFIAGEDDFVDGFEKIAANQNFYIDADGNIVIAFDECEVGPASDGAPQFTIPADVITSIYK